MAVAVQRPAVGTRTVSLVGAVAEQRPHVVAVVVGELAAAEVDAEHDRVVVGRAVGRRREAVVGSLELRVVVDDRRLVGVDVPLLAPVTCASADGVVSPWSR